MMRNEKRAWWLEFDVVGTTSKIEKVAEGFDVTKVNENLVHVKTHEMVGDKGLANVKSTIDAILATKVEIRSVRVHHNVRDYSITNVRAIFALYHRFENTVADLLKGHGLGNGSFKSFDFAVLEKVETVDKLPDTKGLRLSFESYTTDGTASFAQLLTPQSSDEIVHWVALTQLFVERAKSETKKVNVGLERTEINRRQLKKVLTRDAEDRFAPIFGFWSPKVEKPVKTAKTDEKSTKPTETKKSDVKSTKSVPAPANA